MEILVFLKLNRKKGAIPSYLFKEDGMSPFFAN
jgi:hypothetical protein